MRHTIYKGIVSAAAILSLAACEKENSFVFDTENGQLDCKSLDVDYINDQTRAAGISVNDFTINFINTATSEIVRTFKYSAMPELVTLPVGNYKVAASFGDNPVADWDAPFYFGNSDFSIKVGEITDNVDPVECTLSNIRVSVNIDDLGLGIVDDDWKVIVRAGKEGELEFNNSKAGKHGYFRYVEGSNTITATFSGTVDGESIEGKTYTFNDAAAGNAYGINFNINRPNNVDPGDITINDDITIDATITIKDVTQTVNPDEQEDKPLVDDMRPVDGSTTTDPEPGTDPEPTVKGPVITPTSEGLILNEPYTIGDNPACAFTVTSEKGIQELTIDIVSDKLTPQELESTGLSDHLDLVNPGSFADTLTGLGFPNGEAVKGQNSVNLEISSMFLGLLSALGPGDHKFNLTVTDADGTTTGTIWLVTQ